MMRFIRFLAPVWLLLALLAPGLSGLAQPVAYATPAPAIQLRANAVLADTASTVTVQGTNFTRWSTVTLRLNKQDNTLIVGSVRAGSRGTFTATASIPTTPAGEYTLSATDTANRSASASLYAVGLTLSPSRAPSGMQVTISGSGFLDSQPTTVRLGTITIVSSTTDSSGAFQSTFTVPASLKGAQPLVLQQGTGPALVLRGTFTITRPVLTITPSTAGIGQTVAISGTGFAPEWDHNLRLDDQPVSTLHTNSEGAFGPIPFTVPSGTSTGRHEIILRTSAGGTVGSTILTINVTAATLTLTPSTGVAGVDVQVSGTGFQPGETVSISAGTTLLATPSASTSGQISAVVTLPRTLSAGAVSVDAVGQASRLTATASYVIPLPGLSLSHSSVQAGTTLTVTGRNFAAREDVDLVLGSTPLATVTADASGGFVTSVTVPASQPAGANEIAATAKSSTQVVRASLSITIVYRISVNITTVQEGGTVTVTGVGYGPGEAVVLSIPDFTLGTVAANDKGEFSATVTIPVIAPVSQVTLTATGQQTRRTASAVLTVTPLAARLILSTGTLMGGASFQVSGSGFRSSEQVQITVPGHTLTTTTTNDKGEFSSVTVTLPSDVGPGAVTVSASGLRSQKTATASLSITVVPHISLNTSTVQEGSTLTVNGVGYGPGEAVVLSIPDFTLHTVAANDKGEFSATVTIPVTAPASHVTLNATGQQTQRTASAALTVTPLPAHLTLSASSLVMGSSFKVSVSGFRTGEQVQIIVSGHILTTTTANDKGEISNVTVTLPSDVGPGAVTVSASGLHSQKTATASLSITVVPRLSLNTSTAQEGSTITVTGVGFGPGEPVVLSIPGFTLQSVAANAQGEFTTAVAVPVTAPISQVTLTATGQQTQRTALAALNVTQVPARLTLSAGSLVMGSSFQVGGSGYRSGEQVQITVVGRILATVTTSNRGEFGNVSVTLPVDVGPGAFTISARGLQSQKAANAGLSITVAARISLNTSTVQEGSTVSVTGVGYAPGEPVVLSIPGFTLHTVVANGQGGFYTAVTIPVTAPVSQVALSATGQYTRRTASAVLTVTLLPARLTLSSSLLVVGASFQVSGSGFRSGEVVQISVPGHMLATLTTSNRGEFTKVTVTLPTDVGPGAITVSAAGLHSQKIASAGLSITVVPRISLNTTTLQEGSTLTITGMGYGPGEPVVVNIPGFTLQTAAANAQGEFSTSVTIPVTAPVSQVTLTATGQQTRRAASAALTVTQLPARLTLSTNWLVVGGSFQVSGNGFRASEQVQITVPGYVLATVLTNSKGELSNVGVTLPSGVGPGALTLSARGLQSQKATGASMTVIPRSASLSIAPSTITHGTQVRIEGVSFLPGEQVDLLLNGSFFTTMRAGSGGSFVLTTTLPSYLGPGSHRIMASGLTSHLVAAANIQLTLPAPERVGSTTWYFASGRTDNGFSEQINVLNTNTRSVQGTITFFYGANQTKVYPFTLREQARGTYDVASMLGVSTHFATMVQANLPIAVARTSQHGSDAMTGGTGVSTASRTWYMAEGYTGLTFQEELDLLNPGNQATFVHIVWTLFNGKAPVVHDVVLAPRSHLTIPVNSYVDRASHATVVTADQPIVASRTMLFGAYQQGAHATAGATQADTTLYFAEGSTSNGFEEYLTILNPHNTQPAQVTATFYDRQGTLLATRVIVVDPMHRGNIKVNEVIRGSAIATVLRSTLPIVAERSMYFGSPNSGSADGTVVFGRATPALGWAFASGDTRNGRSEFELLFNPNGASSTILATFYGEDGRTLQRTFTLAGHSRLNIDVTLLVPELARGLHGVVLQSTNGVSFVAEQALYANYMRSGSATLGTPMG